MPTVPPQSSPGRKSASLDDLAIDWLVHLHSGHAGPEDAAAFAAWRRQSPVHNAAAVAAETLWRDIGATRAAAASRRRGFTRRALVGGALAACVAGLLFVSGFIGSLEAMFADYATTVGESRRVELLDGSVAILNTRTAISVDYSDKGRRVRLDAGEATFEVRKDPARPFVVAADGGESLAVGTIFTVRRNGNSVSVLVEEGIVQVTAPGRVPVRLSTGRAIAYGQDASGTPEEADIRALTAWRRGKLIFNRKRLVDVIAEFERYGRGRIVVADAALGAREVTGVFDLTDPSGLVETVARTLPGATLLRLPLVTVLY